MESYSWVITTAIQYNHLLARSYSLNIFSELPHPWLKVHVGELGIWGYSQPCLNLPFQSQLLELPSMNFLPY